MGAPFISPKTVTVTDLPEPATLADVRDAMDALLADAARARHMRRELERAANHGTVLLAALGLPRLVTPDFEPIDREVVGDALDVVIAHLDALDAPDEDLEDGGDAERSLGWTESGPRFCYDYEDREADNADGEPSLASPERHPTVPGWSTPGLYVDRGPDSSQLRWAEGAQHDGETVNEDGDDLDRGEHDESDKEPSIGWPNDYRAVLSDALQADHDPEEVNEDGEEPAVPRGHPLASKMVGERSHV